MLFFLLFESLLHVSAADVQRFSPLALLSIHNFYRCLHGTQPMKWNNTLQMSAQKWAANRQAAQCDMQHSGYPGVGENVAAGTYRGLDGSNYDTSDIDMVNHWYNETWWYDYSLVPGPGYNHFSQVVWNGTSDVGCAWVWCEDLTYEFWVCQYYPPGNWAGEDPPNVPAPCRQPSQCMAALNQLNLTQKYNSPQQEAAELEPNKINPTTYIYNNSACYFAADLYTSVIHPPPPVDMSEAKVGIAIAVVILIVIAIIAASTWYRRRHAVVSGMSPQTNRLVSPMKTETPSVISSPSAPYSPPGAETNTNGGIL